MQVDQPLDTRFTSGTGLTEGAGFTQQGKADFTDISFHGHPSQYYNLVTFSLNYRLRPHTLVAQGLSLRPHTLVAEGLMH
jgi:hypothetical protein